MRILKMHIENFEGIENLSVHFNRTCTRLQEKNSADIIKAIGLVLEIKTMMKPDGFCELQENTQVTAICERNNGEVSEESFFPLNLNEEEKELCVFNSEDTNQYNKRFEQYLDPKKFYRENDFEKRTLGAGNTRVFRTILQEHKSRGDNFEKFCALNKVWQELEKIRSFEHEEAPIIIIGADKEKIQKAKKLNRQIIYTCGQHR